MAGLCPNFKKNQPDLRFHYFKPIQEMKKSILLILLAGTALNACAQTPDSASRISRKADTAVAPAAPTSPVSTPGMAGPLSVNPAPLKIHTRATGDVYVSGAVTGMYQAQNNVSPGDRASQADLSNGQVFIQKVDGLVQFFVEAGSYSTPDLGLPYLRSGNSDSSLKGATNGLFGVMPQAFIKIAPSANFSIMAGKLPTLIGAEYTFSFENMNIERGLLWNQENAVNRGVQVNFKTGPVAFALSWNDGFYSNSYTWAWGSATYSVNAANTIALIGGGNTRISTVSNSATPLYQNNEQIYNLIYTHTTGPWTVEPYIQLTYIPKSVILGTTSDPMTSGVALFVNYAFHSRTPDAGFNLPIRMEYISSSGTAGSKEPNLLYGPGSNAWSFTVTPTYQFDRFFIRGEFSFVGAGSITNGAAFGPTGTGSSQTRAVLEGGLLF